VQDFLCPYKQINGFSLSIDDDDDEDVTAVPAERGLDKDTLVTEEASAYGLVAGCDRVAVLYILQTTWSSSKRTSESASQVDRSPSGDNILSHSRGATLISRVWIDQLVTRITRLLLAAASGMASFSPRNISVSLDTTPCHGNLSESESDVVDHVTDPQEKNMGLSLPLGCHHKQDYMRRQKVC
jgi:hypothetical protein